MTQKIPGQLRGTDETFLQLMQLSGAGLLKLAGFSSESADSYEFRAIEFKEKQLQRPDIEGIPILEGNTRVTIEFQGYLDKYIRYRSLNNMLQICLKTRDDKPVQGLIVYTNKHYQTGALNLNKLLALPGKIPDLIQELVLTEYTEADLLTADPRLIVLAPFTISSRTNAAQLQHKVLNWRHQIEQIYPTNEQFTEALNIIGLLLLNRFRKLSHQEVITMLNLNLMDSRAGQDIYRMGKNEGLLEGKQEGLREGEQKGKREGLQEGEQKGKREGLREGLREGEQKGKQEGERQLVMRLLERRFGKLPTAVKKRLGHATLSELEQWSVRLLDAHSLEDIFKE